MICYRDKTHCRGYNNSEKCKACDRYFNQKEYDKFCKERGFKLPISFFTEPLCKDEKDEQK